MLTKTLSSRQFLHSAIVVALLSLSACATTGKQNNDNAELDLSKYSTMTTQDAVTSLESNYQTSDKTELATYAPSYYSTAGKAIEDAKTLLAASQPRDKIVHKVAVAEAVLKNGARVMHKVKDILEPEISIKEKLDALNTKSTYRNEYGSLNERLNALILEIESGNPEKNVDREKLLKDMQRLERKSLYFNVMNEPREILKRVKYRGGEQLAPITYGEAIAVFKRAEEFIEQNPNYDLGITQIGREALFAAKRALYVAEAVSTLKQKIAFSPEQIILDEEYRMYRVARRLADLDYRDNSLEVQSELLAKKAEEVALELINKDDLVIALRDTLIKVRDSSTRLTMLSESSEQLKKEKNEWLAKEALFKAKIVQLEENLGQSVKQLDSTQQTLLTIKADNTRLTEYAHTEEHKVIALEKELAQLTLNKTDVTASKAHISENAKAVTPIAGEAGIDKVVADKAVADKTSAETKIATTPGNEHAHTEEPETHSETAQSHTPESVEKSKVTKNHATSANGAAIKETNDGKKVVTLPKKNERAKITEQETLDAIQSAKELIKTLKKSDEKRTAKTKTPSSAIGSGISTGSPEFFIDADKAFVEADE